MGGLGAVHYPVELCEMLHTQLILIIYQFCMCEFAYSVKFLVTSKSILTMLSQSFTDIHRAAKNLRLPSMHSQLRSFKTMLCCLVSVLILCKQVSFSQSIWCHVFHIFVLLLVISLFETAPKHSAKALSSVSKCKKAVLYRMEKIYLSDKLLSGKSYRAADCEFNV